MAKTNIKELKANEGRYLTQVAEVGNDRLFITALKGANINEADWLEATEEEKAAFENEHKAKEEEARKAELENIKNE